MKTVAIVGVGLIGGSFGLALRAAGFDGEIFGVSSPPALESALRIGAISSPATLEEAAQRADLIYLAQPVDRILETLEKLGPIAPARLNGNGLQPAFARCCQPRRIGLVRDHHGNLASLEAALSDIFGDGQEV